MRALPALVLVAALCACSPSAPPKGEGEAPALVQAASNKLTPGQWRTTVTFLEMNMPGMPQGAMNMQPIESTECVTSDDIGGFINRKAIHDAKEDMTCVSDSFSAAGGAIQASSTCSLQGGVQQRMTMTGAYGPEKVDMTIAMDGQTPRGAMSSKMQMTAQRIGACPG